MKEYEENMQFSFIFLHISFILDPLVKHRAKRGTRCHYSRDLENFQALSFIFLHFSPYFLHISFILSLLARCHCSRDSNKLRARVIPSTQAWRGDSNDMKHDIYFLAWLRNLQELSYYPIGFFKITRVK